MLVLVRVRVGGGTRRRAGGQVGSRGALLRVGVAVSRSAANRTGQMEWLPLNQRRFIRPGMGPATL